MKLTAKTMASLMKGKNPLSILAEDMKTKGVTSMVFTIDENEEVIQKNYTVDVIKAVQKLAEDSKEKAVVISEMNATYGDLEDKNEALENDNERLKSTIYKMSEDLEKNSLLINELRQAVDETYLEIKERNETVTALKEEIEALKNTSSEKKGKGGKS